MRSKSKWPLLVLLLGLLLNSLPASAQEDDPLLASMRKAGEVKGALASAPPYIIITSRGKATGYTPDLVNLILKDMNLPEFTPIQLDWAAQIPALLAHQVDMVGVGYLINSVACKQVIFSAPIFVQRQVLFVPLGNPKHLTSFAQIGKTPDVKLAVVAPPVKEPESGGIGDQNRATDNGP